MKTEYILVYILYWYTPTQDRVRVICELRCRFAEGIDLWDLMEHIVLYVWQKEYFWFSVLIPFIEKISQLLHPNICKVPVIQDVI